MSVKKLKVSAEKPRVPSRKDGFLERLYSDTREKKKEEIRTRNFPDVVDKSTLARDSRPLDDTMRKLFRATTGYVITALLRKPPSRPREPHTNEIGGPSGTAITKPMEKATYPARHVCKDTQGRHTESEH